jgi:hypothetical protein
MEAAPEVAGSRSSERVAANCVMSDQAKGTADHKLTYMAFLRARREWAIKRKGINCGGAQEVVGCYLGPGTTFRSWCRMPRTARTG